MYVVRIDRAERGKEPVTMWLKSVMPQRWGPREQARTFETKGEARTAAEAVKAIGWTLEEHLVAAPGAAPTEPNDDRESP